MESSEDDAGPATNASCRASARERDMGDVDATTSFQHDSSEVRTSCGTPAMSDLDVDSVPSPSAHDVNTSTEAILDMIDEFVDGPGAPKRIPPRTDDIWFEQLPAPKVTEDQQEFKTSILDDRPPQPSLPSHEFALSETVYETSSEKHENESSSVELTTEPTSSIETNPTVSTITDSVPSEPNIFSATIAVDIPDNVHVLSNQSNQSEILPSNDSNSAMISDVPVPQISTDQTTVVQSVPPVEAECTSNLLLDSDKTVPNIVISKSDEVQTNYSKEEIIESNECQQTVSSPVPSVSIEIIEIKSTDCLSATVSHDSVILAQSNCSNSVIESVNENPGECQILINENVMKTAIDSPLNKSPDNAVSEPPEVIPSSSNVNTSSDNSECQPQRTVKCDTSGANRDTVTVENAESTSSDIKLEEKPSSPMTKTPLRRRLVRPALSDRKPDTTVSSSTADTQASDTTVEELVSSECIAKSVSSSSDTVEICPGIVNQEDTSNISDVSVCKAETSSPTKRIKLVRQKTTPTPATSSNIPEKQEIRNNEQEPCQSSSDNIPLTLCKHTELKKLICGGEPIETNRISTELVFPSLPIEDESNESSQKECCPKPESSKEIEIKIEEKKVPPLKLNLNASNTSECSKAVNLEHHSSSEASSDLSSESDATKQVPKLTIKLGSIQQEEVKSPIPKLTIKPIQPPPDLNIVSDHDCDEQIPSVTKINIKPIIKPSEKVNEIHRKSSSSEISESESSENDDSTSTSDQASTSDQGPSDVVPKVTIKLGKPGTTIEGKFYTEQNVPKLTIKNIQNEKEEHEPVSKLKLIINQSEEKQTDKVPKLTIKTMTGKCEGQPMSPKLVIKPIPSTPQSVEYANKDKSDQLESQPIPKLKISTEPFASVSEVKENMHVPKITIKPVTRSDIENVPAVTKLNIKPIVKPEGDEVTEKLKDEKVPVVSKLNIKPIIKPSEIADCTDDTPKVAKLNIKVPKNSGDILEAKDCDEWNANIDGNSIPIVTKINIKPIVKPQDEDSLKDLENQSSETGNSSDDNTDSIPVVTKINIKPIVKPNEPENIKLNDESIPVVTKLNIKPVVKPEETSLLSPKKGNTKPAEIPIVTKLNIKPLIKPEEIDTNSKELDEVTGKNPPLVMKINMKAMAEPSVESTSLDKKSNHIDDDNCLTHNNITENIPVVSKLNIKPIPKPIDVNTSERNTFEIKTRKSMASINTLQQVIDKSSPVQENYVKQNCVSVGETKSSEIDNFSSRNEVNYHDKNRENMLLNVNSQSTEVVTTQNMPSVQNCTLLKKLLETKNEVMENKLINDVKIKISNRSPIPSDTMEHNYEIIDPSFHTEKVAQDHKKEKSKTLIEINDVASLPVATKSDVTLGNCNIVSESLTKPLEISISDKITNQSSGQDSPRIILKINKTDHGASAKIITEETRRPESPQASNKLENTHELENDKDCQKKGFVNSRRKAVPEINPGMPVGKRLRSSRVVKESDKAPLQKRATAKRPPTLITSPTKEPELSVLESKRIKLGELLSNKSLSITPIVTKVATTSPPNKPCLDIKESEKTVNHSLLNNENRSKNGNSKLQNILSNLHAKQIQVNTINDINRSENSPNATPDMNSNTSTSCSSDVIEVVPVEKCPPEVQEMLISENSESHDFPVPNDDLSQDPLEVDTSKISIEVTNESANIPVQMLTPMPKKRGRPRKTPLSEGARPVTLPTPALEERPVRSLRLSRERPAILAKPRGRGRGRGAKRGNPSPQDEHAVDASNRLFNESQLSDDIDPMSSRIKLPRMTEAFDKSVCSTPLSSRRRSSEMYDETPELKVVLEGIPDMKSPEPTGRGRGGRGRGRGRTPRGRGRARGGGKGAVYMKETMGIYGRVCGPATTTVELFEEETCMMDDNATPAKPSHLLDEDSQSSVKSSTNESSKMKKSKFADLFDSSKVWTAADVKEYKWPPPELKSDVKSQVMMVQEQVAMFLGVKSFKRRYPELVRRAIVGEEKDYVLSKGLVTEALCDLGITAVDASDVLDIMLSDYPHKYEEYRSHQRRRQIAELTDVNVEPEVKLEKIEIVKPEQKPEPPKIDPEKARQEMAAAAVASASEFNARMNASRRTACVDLQSLTICRRRAPAAPREPAEPAAPAALYPHALLPGQYQHHYRTYTAHQLRYFPLNTVLSAPPRVPSPVPSSSDSEADWGSRTDSSDDGFTMPTPKRKKLTKVKRSSKTETESLIKEEPKVEQEVEVCRICKLREEINKKHPERFLVCTTCNSKLHPSCLAMPGDRCRKVRAVGWQCADCKACAVCRAPQHADKMLFCDLCDRGHHIYCVGLDHVPDGRWHCAECAICKSCGSRDAWGPVQGPGAPDAQWHHQTKRGPGGHKVFSHSLCTPCARAYRIGRYCPLCERSFIGPKGTMQLVICKLCDRQLHQDCVRQSVCNLNVLDYTCGECRRGGITSRAAAVRLAPRTIATLFMAKRRFNKYAHKQYMQRRKPALQDECSASDPLEGATNAEETAAAVEALRRDFGD